MPTCLARGSDISYTLMPYVLDTPVEDGVKKHRTDKTLGFVTYTKETRERSFIYTESGNPIETTDHWSLKLLQECPHLESTHPWIVYTCDPEEVPHSFNELTCVGQCLHIYNWDTWKVEEKKGTVAIVTAYDIY